MKKLIFLIIFTAVILIVQLSIYPLNLSTSIIPGRHTTIFPSSYFSLISTIITFVIPVITSLLLFKKVGNVNLKVFIPHVLISVTILSLQQISMLFVNHQDLNNLEENLTDITAIILTILAIEQLLFGIYIFREIKKLR